MCNAVYLAKEQHIKDCYYKTEQTVEVRLQHVLKTGIELEQITDPKQVPKGVREKRLLSREVYIRLIVMILKIFFNKSDAEKHLNTLKKNPVRSLMMKQILPWMIQTMMRIFQMKVMMRALTTMFANLFNVMKVKKQIYK